MTWFRLGREDGATSEDHANNINGQRRQNGAAAKAVLIVDDNADIREYVRGILSSRYRVSCASSGKMAMELIHQGLRPDLVLADIMMPQMDGYALLKALKNETILSDVPVIFLSAKASENARVEGLRRGADDYLVKPFSSVELLARVGAGLRRGTRAGVGGR